MKNMSGWCIRPRSDACSKELTHWMELANQESKDGEWFEFIHEALHNIGKENS